MAGAAPDIAGSRRGRILAGAFDLVLVAGFVAAILPDLVFTNRTLSTGEFWTDLFTLTQPSFRYTGERLARGELPLWNPNWFAGYPHMAMPSACVFYPTTVLFGLMPFAAGLKAVVLLHVYLAGAFSYVLGRSTLGRRLPALYFAFAAIAGDMVLAPLRVSHLWVLQTLAWFPLAVYFTDRLCRGGRWGSVVGLALTLAMMAFGGDPQSLAFGLYFLAIYSLVFGIAHAMLRESGGVRTGLSPFARIALAVILGAGLAGVQLIPSRELFSESVRANGVAFEQISFGPTAKLIEAFAWLREEDQRWVMSASRTVIALAVIGVVFVRTPRAYATLIAGLLCFLYSVMPRWFYDAVAQYVPVYNSVRGAIRMSALAWWSTAFLSAMGVAAWTRPAADGAGSRRRIALTTLAALAIATGLPALMGTKLPAGRLAACVLGASGMVLGMLRTRGPLLWACATAVVLAAAGSELGWKVHRVGFSSPLDSFRVNEGFAKFSAARKDMDRVALVYAPAALPQGPAIEIGRASCRERV